MTLHLIELPLSLRDLHVWAGGRRLTAGDEGLILHHLLGETFGPGVLQPFRLMVSPRAQAGTLYAYAADDADTLRQMALACLTPGQHEVIRVDQMRSISRPPTVWRSGQRLGFDVRVRPVARLHSDLTATDDAGKPFTMRKGAEVDVFLSRRLRGRQEGREAAYLEWLAERLMPAAQLDVGATRLSGFQRQVVMRKGRRIEGPDATFHGSLVVTDPEAFTILLARGVGRHRAYGYGMLLLRPPQRQAPA